MSDAIAAAAAAMTQGAVTPPTPQKEQPTVTETAKVDLSKQKPETEKVVNPPESTKLWDYGTVEDKPWTPGKSQV